MGEFAEFIIEDMIYVAPLSRGGAIEDLKFEQMVGKLRELQQGKRILEEKVKEIKSGSDSLQKELLSFQTKAYQLEGIHKEKEELCRKLQFQCEESEQYVTREFMQNKETDKLMEQYKCEIQEFKLKQRKQRMRFENQLHQLIDQHKRLNSVFTLERLPDEIESAENTKRQLLSAEKMKLAELHRLIEELEEVKKRQQPERLRRTERVLMNQRF